MEENSQLRQFVAALTGDERSEVTFQSYYDPEGEETPVGVYPEFWTASVEDSANLIDEKQAQKCGVHIVINQTDGKGRSAENVTELRALFADFDNTKEPLWTLQPHIIQTRDETHGHAIWLIDPADLTASEWTILQRQLAMFYSTDDQLIDPCRTLRAPGTWHFKDPSSPAMYSIKVDKSKTLPKYSIKQIREAHPLDLDKLAELHAWAEAREGIQTGAGYDDDPYEIDKLTQFAKFAAHPAVSGSGGGELYRVACFGHDHGVSIDKCKEILWKHYNPRCMPPWKDEEKYNFEGICENGYKYSSSAPGCKSISAQLLELPPLEEPACGWGNMKSQFTPSIAVTPVEVKEVSTSEDNDNRGLRISEANATSMSAQITMKSGHYDFALVYDGLKYDGLHLLKSEKQFYHFNGASWEKVDDDVIKADIQRAFVQFKPNNKLTSGIYAVLVDMVNRASLRNGMWLDDPFRNTDNLAVFQNGIVDMNSEELEVTPHTHKFFSLNHLGYEFDKSAICSEWHKFLESIWGDDQKLKDQLQEFMGYCLVNDVSLQKFAIFMGKSRAGKGVITKIMAKIVGEENVGSPSLSNLVKDSALCEMSTKSLTLIPDAHSVHTSIRDAVLSTLKAVTGGDSVSFHELYKGSRNSVFKTKIVMSTNNVPDFNDPSGALVNRALIFPFPRSFAGSEDVHLKARLNDEIAGIVQWAVEGLQRLKRNNGVFTESESGKAEKSEMRKDMFPLSAFVESMLSVEAGVFTPLEELYKAYRLWATMEGVKSPYLKSTFNKLLRNSALDISHKKDGYKGVRVKQEITNNNVESIK